MLAPAADTVFGWDRGPLAALDAWIGVLAFSGQIFFDFAGYSTTAIGAAYCFGFSLPDNFRCPYAAIGFSDFWRRWHISLSTWLRDYLYIPLGGNRFGTGRTVASLMITMLLGGLWHGAAWTFVVWGGLHGIFLVVERGARHLWGDKAFLQTLASRLLLGLLTWFLVNITWVFFRAPDFPAAFLLLLSMFGIPAEAAQALPMLEIAKVCVVVPLLLLFQWLFRSKRTEEAAASVPSWVHGLAWAGMLVLLILAQGSDDAFIYFQF
jgi:alginate O-acetyltransferase complex protein AlgI